jgi:hypothetical protein
MHRLVWRVLRAQHARSNFSSSATLYEGGVPVRSLPEYGECLLSPSDRTSLGHRSQRPLWARRRHAGSTSVSKECIERMLVDRDRLTFKELRIAESVVGIASSLP